MRVSPHMSTLAWNDIFWSVNIATIQASQTQNRVIQFCVCTYRKYHTPHSLLPRYFVCLTTNPRNGVITSVPLHHTTYSDMRSPNRHKQRRAHVVRMGGENRTGLWSAQKSAAWVSVKGQRLDFSEGHFMLYFSSIFFFWFGYSVKPIKTIVPKFLWAGPTVFNISITFGVSVCVHVHMCVCLYTSCTGSWENYV